MVIKNFIGTNFHCPFLCFVLIGFFTAFKVLYKESTDTVDRPSIMPPTKQSDNNGEVFTIDRDFP